MVSIENIFKVNDICFNCKSFLVNPENKIRHIKIKEIEINLCKPCFKYCDSDELKKWNNYCNEIENNNEIYEDYIKKTLKVWIMIDEESRKKTRNNTSMLY